MTKEQVLELLDKIKDRPPYSEIEKELQLPKGTLNQILRKGSTREMPHKHRKKFRDYCERPVVEIVLPNGKKTKTDDPVIIQYFNELKKAESAKVEKKQSLSSYLKSSEPDISEEESSIKISMDDVNRIKKSFK